MKMTINELIDKKNLLLQEGYTLFGEELGDKIHSYWCIEYEHSIPNSITLLNELRIKELKPILDYLPSYDHANNRTEQYLERLKFGEKLNLLYEAGWLK